MHTHTSTHTTHTIHTYIHTTLTPHTLHTTHTAQLTVTLGLVSSTIGAELSLAVPLSISVPFDTVDVSSPSEIPSSACRGFRSPSCQVTVTKTSSFLSGILKLAAIMRHPKPTAGPTQLHSLWEDHLHPCFELPRQPDVFYKTENQISNCLSCISMGGSQRNTNSVSKTGTLPCLYNCPTQNY